MSLNAASFQTTDRTEVGILSHIKRTGIKRSKNNLMMIKYKKFIGMAQNKNMWKFNFFAYNKAVFRPFNSGSFYVRTDNVRFTIWQLADFKDTLSKR